MTTLHRNTVVTTRAFTTPDFAAASAQFQWLNGLVERQAGPAVPATAANNGRPQATADRFDLAGLFEALSRIPG